MQGDQEACLAAEMDDYLSTPLTSEGLRQTLASWISEMEQTERDISDSRRMPAFIRCFLYIPFRREYHESSFRQGRRQLLPPPLALRDQPSVRLELAPFARGTIGT